MNHSICGVDCTKCQLNSSCKGCNKTKGHPFGGDCVVAMCLKESGSKLGEFKKNLITAINNLKIPDMEEIKELNALKGSLINIEYPLPNGKFVKILDDNKIYLGNQVSIKNSDYYYGIIGDEKYLLVSKYRDYGVDSEVIVFKQWQ